MNTTFKKSPIVFLSLMLFALLLSMQSTLVSAKENSAEPRMKHYLMIGKPSDATWANLVKGEVDMSPSGKAGIEAMGGEMLGFYIGVGESKNYAIVAFPESLDVAKIVYTRAMQGVMDEIQFIEIMTTAEASEVFKSINANTIGGNTK